MVVFQFANDIRAGKKVCYTLSRCPHRLAAKDATLSRWISRVRIPLGAPFKLKSPLPSRWRAFLLPMCRDSNPTGCGAEETRKRFPAQHARSEATQRKRAAPAARGHPAGGTTESEKPVTNSVAGFLLPIRRDSNPEGIKSHCHPRARGQKMANMSTVTILVTEISCLQKAI